MYTYLYMVMWDISIYKSEKLKATEVTETGTEDDSVVEREKKKKRPTPENSSTTVVATS